MGLISNLFLFCGIIFVCGECANILFFAATPSKSHQVMFQPVWKELSLRGHNVVAITPDPLNDKTLTNLTEVDLSSLYVNLKEALGKSDNREMLINKPSFLTVFIKDIIITKFFNNLGKIIFEHPNFQEFLQLGYKFDIVIVEYFFPTFTSLGPYFNASIVGITSLGAPIPSLDALGNPSHPVTAPDHNLPVTRDMSFRERLLSGLWAVYVRIYYHLVILPREDKTVKHYLGADMPYIGDIERNISLLLLNRNPVFHRVMPVVPSIIELGYMKHNKTLKKLEPKLQNFLDNSKDGAIYFSFGSNIQLNFLPEQILSEIFKALDEIPYNVVLKWNSEEPNNLPKNIMLVSWVPQSSLLAHKNVKLFITQGGLQSSDEAIINQIPIIGIPFASDQTANVDTLVKYGVGKMIDVEEITAEKFKALIKEIITNSSYKDNVIQLSKVYTDYPVDSVEKAIWWIEYVIRHKGASHLRSIGLELPWYQYMMMDIILFISIILIVVLSIIYIILKTILKVVKRFISKMCKCNKSKKE